MWTERSKVVPMTRSSWFQRPWSQSRLDQEITRCSRAVMVVRARR